MEGLPLFAAQRGTGIVAAIDFAGASATWAGSPLLQERMKAAARSARVPVLFVQAENDYDTAPSRELFAEMQKAGRPARLHVFPPERVDAGGGAWILRRRDEPSLGRGGARLPERGDERSRFEAVKAPGQGVNLPDYFGVMLKTSP